MLISCNRRHLFCCFGYATSANAIGHRAISFSLASSNPFANISPQLLTGLTTLNSAISELARSYNNHTNKMLGSAGLTPALDPDAFPSAFSNLFTGGSSLLPGLAVAATGAPSAVGGHGMNPGVVGGVAGGAVDRKARAPRKPRRRVKDPNAPKRPLTGYFLFAMDERPKVKEMMPHAASHEVNAEILNRWKNMADENKSV
jgi:hypothetical protein